VLWTVRLERLSQCHINCVQGQRRRLCCVAVCSQAKWSNAISVLNWPQPAAMVTLILRRILEAIHRQGKYIRIQSNERWYWCQDIYRQPQEKISVIICYKLWCNRNRMAETYFVLQKKEEEEEKRKHIACFSFYVFEFVCTDTLKINFKRHTTPLSLSTTLKYRQLG